MLGRSSFPTRMSTTPPQKKKAYPSYESLRDSNLLFGPSPSFCRIRWQLKPTIFSSISILADPFHQNGPYPLEPYITPSDSSLHPISHLPLTTPPCSSLTLSLPLLNDFPSNWREVHSHCSPHPGDPGVQFDTSTASTDPVTGFTYYGDLLQCCHQSIPSPGPSLTIHAPSDSEGFLAIGRFISVLHPWLLDLEPRIRAAIEVWQGTPLEENFSLFVYPLEVDALRILDDRDDGMGRSWGLKRDWEIVEKFLRKWWPIWEAKQLVGDMSVAEEKET